MEAHTFPHNTNTHNRKGDFVFIYIYVCIHVCAFIPYYAKLVTHIVLVTTSLRLRCMRFEYLEEPSQRKDISRDGYSMNT